MLWNPYLVWAQDDFVHPDFEQLTQNSPQKLAILPVEIKFNLRPNQKEKLSPEQLKESQLKEGNAAQHSLYKYFSKRAKKSSHITLQTVFKTNSLLKREKISLNELSNYAMQDLAQILDVDALVFASIETDRDLSKGVATISNVVISVASGWYGGPGGVSGDAEFLIYHGETGELLWRYNRYAPPSSGNNLQDIVDFLSRKAAKNCPYFK